MISQNQSKYSRGFLMNDEDLEHIFQSIPAIIFCKDTEGKYLAANDICIKITGNRFERDIIGKSDKFLWGESSVSSQLHDQEVIHSGKSKSYIEYGKIHTGKIIAAVSYKTPLCDRSGKNIGILGMGFLLNETNEMISLFEKKGFLVDRNMMNSVVSNENNQITKLSERQLDCLFYLIKGMTFKQIGNELNLSPRTVEHYIEKIKIRLDCFSRSDLIAKALKLPAIKERLLSE